MQIPDEPVNIYDGTSVKRSDALQGIKLYLGYIFVPIQNLIFLVGFTSSGLQTVKYDVTRNVM